MENDCMNISNNTGKIVVDLPSMNSYTTMPLLNTNEIELHMFCQVQRNFKAIITKRAL